MLQESKAVKFVFPADENDPEAIDALGRHMHQNLRVRILAKIYNLFLLCSRRLGHRYTREIPDRVYCEWCRRPRDSNWGPSSFCRPHAKTNAEQSRSRSLHAVQHFMCVYCHAQTTVDAGDIRT